MARNFGQFFLAVTRHEPFPYQGRLAENPWPDVPNVPTGLGKSAAVTLTLRGAPGMPPLSSRSVLRRSISR